MQNFPGNVQLGIHCLPKRASCHTPRSRKGLHQTGCWFTLLHCIPGRILFILFSLRKTLDFLSFFFFRPTEKNLTTNLHPPKANMKVRKNRGKNNHQWRCIFYSKNADFLIFQLAMLVSRRFCGHTSSPVFPHLFSDFLPSRALKFHLPMIPRLEGWKVATIAVGHLEKVRRCITWRGGNFLVEQCWNPFFENMRSSNVTSWMVLSGITAMRYSLIAMRWTSRWKIPLRSRTVRILNCFS